MGLFDALGSIISGIASEIDGGDDYPTCDMCGSKMTEFDGWAWYTCPECGNMVRVLDGEKKWERDIFGGSSSSETCENCGQSLSGGEYTAPWEDGDNEDGYIICPHCHHKNTFD